MKNKIINLFVAAFVSGFIFGGGVFAQSVWLDMNPLPSWNARSRAILQTKKISADELKRCGVTIRQPSLPQDFLLTKMNWTLVGAAQIHGKTTVIGTAGAFDGMCRPLEFEMRFCRQPRCRNIVARADERAHRRFFNQRKNDFGDDFDRRISSLPRVGPALLSV